MTDSSSRRLLLEQLESRCMLAVGLFSHSGAPDHHEREDHRERSEYRDHKGQKDRNEHQEHREHGRDKHDQRDSGDARRRGREHGDNHIRQDFFDYHRDFDDHFDFDHHDHFEEYDDFEYDNDDFAYDFEHDDLFEYDDEHSEPSVPTLSHRVGEFSPTLASTHSEGSSAAEAKIQVPVVQLVVLLPRASESEREPSSDDKPTRSENVAGPGVATEPSDVGSESESNEVAVRNEGDVESATNIKSDDRIDGVAVTNELEATHGRIETTDQAYAKSISGSSRNLHQSESDPLSGLIDLPPLYSLEFHPHQKTSQEDPFEIERDSLKQLRDVLEKQNQNKENDHRSIDDVVASWFGQSTGLIDDIRCETNFPSLSMGHDPVQIDIVLDPTVGYHRSIGVVAASDATIPPNSVRDAILAAIAAEHNDSIVDTANEPMRPRFSSLTYPAAAIVASTLALNARRKKKYVAETTKK